MIGVVLCGGQSTRMGTDKGLIPTNINTTWAQRSYNVLTSLRVIVRVSINRHQYDQYIPMFGNDVLITDRSDLAFQGPLLGLISVHLEYPLEDIIVLACDMVDMEPETVDYLFNQYTQYNRKVSCVFAYKDSIEPLCSIYTSTDLSWLYQLNQLGLLEKQSMKYCIDLINASLVPVPEKWKRNFRNVNAMKF